MRENIDDVIPDFTHRCELLKSITDFDFSPREAQVITALIGDHGPEEIALLLKRSVKTIYRHQENSLRKAGCNTMAGMIYKIKKILPEL